MPPRAYRFDLRDVIATLGSFVIDGAGVGGYITIKYDSPTVVHAEGNQGDSVCFVTQSKKGTATLVLSQASATNDLLAKMERTTRNGGGLVAYPLLVEHRLGTSRAFARMAYVGTPAELAFQNEHQDRTWELGLIDLDLFVGGGVLL